MLLTGINESLGKPVPTTVYSLSRKHDAVAYAWYGSAGGQPSDKGGWSGTIDVMKACKGARKDGCFGESLIPRRRLANNCVFLPGHMRCALGGQGWLYSDW